MLKNMKISKDAIRSKLAAFAAEWKDATREKQEAQQFWNAFCACFDLNKRGKENAPRVAFLFERYQALTSLLPVEKAGRRARIKN